MKYSNVIFTPNINPLGGVESVLYYIVKKYSHKPITIMYIEGSDRQLYRLSKYADVVKFKGQKFECERLFVNYGYEHIKGFVKCDKGYNVIHANYKYLRETDKNIGVIDNDFENLAVSDYAGGKYLDIGGSGYTLCPNPVLSGNPQEPILIVSATRLANDKGNIVERMETLARRLVEREIPFIWLVFTDSRKEFEIPYIVKIPSTLNILPYIKKADFVAQFSDEEACCMTALESLLIGTPMLVTKIPSFYEQGLNEENSIFFDFDMSNVDECIDTMISKLFIFNFTPKPDIWGDLLVGERKEEAIPMKMFKVKANNKWLEGGGIICKDIGRVPFPGEEFIVSEERAKELASKGRTEIIGAIEEPKVEEKPIKVEAKTEENPKVEAKPKKAKKK